MHEFGAARTGNVLTLRRKDLLRLLKTRRQRAPFRREQERRERLLTELRQARLTGIRVTVPTETLTGKLGELPPGVTVEADRIEVQFSDAKEAVARLFALAQALTHDYDRFEALVSGGWESR